MFRIGFTALAACFLGLCLFLASAPLAAQSAQPAWVRNPHAGHNRLAYVAAVGSGNSRQAAERDALRGIAGVFGLNIRAAEEITMLYQEMVVDGATAWTQQAEYRSIIETSIVMDNLMGASVHSTWEDGRGTFFVLAVLNRATAVLLYSDRIRANQDIIRNLTTMPDAQRFSFDGFSRYRFAAVFADMSFAYSEILVVLGAPWAGPLRRGEWFLQRSQEILSEIPIGINVRNDRGGRVQGAFAGAFAGLGFRSAGVNPRFVLDVNVNTWRDEHLVPGVEFAWVELSANLTDTHARAVLLPYGFNLRGSGHFTMAGAENLAFNDAVQRIDREYGNMLADYLARLIPRR